MLENVRYAEKSSWKFRDGDPIKLSRRWDVGPLRLGISVQRLNPNRQKDDIRSNRVEP